MTKLLIILKTGSAPSDIVKQFGDFEHWIAEGLRSAETSLKITVHDARRSDLFPPRETVGGVVITGSAAMVSEREEWSERTAAWLRELERHNVPVLGICYGHQLLAHAFGGTVGYHPEGIEVGTTDVALTASAADDPLLSELPTTFPAQVIHRQTVTALPPGAVSLALNDFEPHHAFRLGEHIWGVQFHPEFSDAVMRSYFNINPEEFAQDGIDAAARSCAVTKSGAAASLLPRFAQYVEKMLAG